jgi:hypothetical protein
MLREYGRVPRRERVYSKKSGKKFARQNIIAAWRAGKIIAPMGYQCNCDAKVVETWAERIL